MLYTPWGTRPYLYRSASPKEKRHENVKEKRDHKISIIWSRNLKPRKQAIKKIDLRSKRANGLKDAARRQMCDMKFYFQAEN